jgi:hypothetical protein
MKAIPWGRIVASLILAAGLYAVAGCGHDHGGGSGSNPAAGSEWDEMKWDQGKWG